MIANQGIETLVKFLTPRNDGIKLATPAALAIRNMSNMPDGIKDPDRVADCLLMALQYQDMQVATYVAEINANLTGNQNLKICFTRQNGIERLIQSLNLFQNKHEFTGPILCCLRHLTGQQQDKGKFFPKVKLTLVIFSTTFEYSRQKLDTKLLENRTFQSIPNLE